MRFLVLDFDGVFWDSVGECYVVAREAERQLSGRTPPASDAWFRELRWLARVGEDFRVMLYLQENTRQAFDALKRELAPEGKRFEELFYAERKRMREQDPKAWAALQRPYPEFLDELPELRKRFEGPVIATTKDAASVAALTAPYGLSLPVVGREFGVDKEHQILHLAQEHGVPCEEMIFIDDLIDNLEAVRRTGARVALAGWGYNTEEERESARREGIPVLRAGRVLEGLLA